jgi:25S rRNA (cytosine2870-C5)-methyltransferase
MRKRTRRNINIKTVAPKEVKNEEKEIDASSDSSSSSSSNDNNSNDSDDDSQSHHRNEDDKDDDDDEVEVEEEGDDDNDSDDENDSQQGGGGGRRGATFSDHNATWLKPKTNKKILLLSGTTTTTTTTGTVTTTTARKSRKENAAGRKQQQQQQDGSDSDSATDSGVDDNDDNDDDDDDDDHDGDDSHEHEENDGEDEEEEEEELEIERMARQLDNEKQEEIKEAEEDVRQMISQHTMIYHLPTTTELAMDQDRVVPPSELRHRIASIIEVLADFKSRREPGRSRSEYISQMGMNIAELFGYIPELIEYFLTIFGPAETMEFVEQSDKPRPLVIRTNTLKTRRKDLAAALMKRGVTLDPLASWSKVGLKIIESSIPIGATPEYLGGHYMLQSAASMCPVLSLAPEPNESVLDMSAAPGGKTSYIAQLMRNTGHIVANDLRPDRQKATVANLHRLGVRNVITSAYDGRKLSSIFSRRFDRVLLDAPCSGLGVISRDPTVKVQRKMNDIKQCAHLQKELLLSAIDTLKCKKGGGGGTQGSSSSGGGVMVYSTCSISVMENEEVIHYALSKRDIRVIDTGLDFGRPGYVRFQHQRFHPSIQLCRRFYPHVHNMDGFFVAKIEKLSDRILSLSNDTINNIDSDGKVMTNEETASDVNIIPEESTTKDDASNCTHQQSVMSKSKKNEGRTPVKTNPKQSRPKTNAKVTKPRRKKQAIESM